jgi:hypothetical protein
MLHTLYHLPGCFEYGIRYLKMGEVLHVVLTLYLFQLVHEVCIDPLRELHKSVNEDKNNELNREKIDEKFHKQ